MAHQQRKLFIDCRMLRHSGIGRYIQELVCSIAPHFRTSLLLGPADVAFGRQLDVPYTISNAPIYSIKEQLDFRRINAADAVFWSPHYNAPLLPVRCKKRLATIHGVFHLAYRKDLSLPKKLYAQLMIGNAVRRSEKIITVSAFSKSEIIKHTGCPESKITVIPNGVKQQPVYQDELFVRNKYELPQQYILFVGNVKPHKNIRCLLEAYCRLSDGLRKKYKVLIVGKKDGFITGDPVLFQWIDSRPELKKNIHFTGFVADNHLDTIYAAASVLVFPSVYEGFGLPPLEAMVNGCPVISANSASMPEVCGGAVLYFDPLQPAELKAQIENVLLDERIRTDLRKKGAVHATKFSWQHSVEAHIGLLESMF